MVLLVASGRGFFRVLPSCLLLLIAPLFLFSCTGVNQGQSVLPPPAPGSGTPVYGCQIVNTYPHDADAYTEGLLYDSGFLYESTGRYGESSLRRVALDTGIVLVRLDLPGYYGEGLAAYGGRLVQLTWQQHTGFIYDKDTFARLGEFAYPWEGWGITFDGKRLIASDGTATLHFLDPDTLAGTGSIEVSDNGVPVQKLNELEYIQGQVFANVWQTDRIAVIDPASGKVTAWIDLISGLAPEKKGPDSVLNGIAWDEKDGRLFVTGKLWSHLYEIKLVGQG